MLLEIAGQCRSLDQSSLSVLKALTRPEVFHANCLADFEAVEDCKHGLHVCDLCIVHLGDDITTEEKCLHTNLYRQCSAFQSGLFSRTARFNCFDEEACGWQLKERSKDSVDDSAIYAMPRPDDPAVLKKFTDYPGGAALGLLVADQQHRIAASHR